MRFQPLNGRLFTKKAPLAAVALAAASFIVMAPSLRAQIASGTAAQAVVQANILPQTKTITTASAAELAAAVQASIRQNPGTSPAVFVEAAIEPYPYGQPTQKLRSDRNSSAATVTLAAITTLTTTGSDANFSSDVADIVNGVSSLTYSPYVHGVQSTTPVEVLATSGQTAVLKDTLQRISDEVVAGVSGTNPYPSSVYLATSGSIGAALTTSTNLELLPKSGLITILQGGIAGITGAKGKDQTIAPEAAASFVTGIVTTGTIPDGATVPTFAYDILAKVAANTNVDELVSNAIGTQYSTESDLESIAQTLFSKFTSAAEIAKVTQGLTAVVSAGGMDENAREQFITDLLSNNTAVPTAKVEADAIPVDEGATFVDPYYASQFTQRTFQALISVGSAKSSRSPYALADADAAKIATAEGTILGSDGDELTQVANVFAGLISTSGSSVLPASSAGTYAADLINGAVKGEPTTVTISGYPNTFTPGEGGKLNVGTPSSVNGFVPVETAMDLAAIGDVLADAVISQDDVSTAAGLKKAESALTTLAEDIAKVTKNQSTTINNSSVAVGVYLAGTLISYVQAELADANSGTAPSSQLAALEAAIIKGVTAITDSAIDAEVKQTSSDSGQYSYTNFPGQGPITTPETTETNL